MRRSWLPVFLVIVLLSMSVLAAGPVLADSEYSVSVENSIDTPTRTVKYQGNSFTISAVARSDAGDSRIVDVTAPSSDAIYQVSLYNADKQIVESHRGIGSDSVEFQLSDLPAGMYMFVVSHRGSMEVIHPLVIRGYAVSVDAPDSATTEDTISVDVTLSKLTDGASMDHVEVVVANEHTDLRETASKDGANSYSATVDVSSLNADTYDVYANVRGPDSVFNQQEVVGISDSQDISVNSPAAEQTSSGSSGGAAGAGGSTTDTPQSETATATPITIPTTTASTPTPTTAPTQTATPDQSRQTTSSNVITAKTQSTPSTATSTPSPTSTTGAINGPALFAIGALATALVLRLRD